MPSIRPYLNEKVVVRRRTGGPSGTGAPVNELNEKDYGVPSTWSVMYAALPARIEVPKAPIQFTEIGERVLPDNIMYIDRNAVVLTEDRVYRANGQIYIVQGVREAYNEVGGINHYEIELLIEP